MLTLFSACGAAKRRRFGAAGHPAGYNIGGSMNTENFLTGCPGTESQHRRVLRRVLGQVLYAAFFDGFMTVPDYVAEDGPRPTSASPPAASRTCSSSPGREARPCCPTCRW